MINKNNSNSNAKIGIKNWIIIWVAGIAGQLCWNIENQWFNTFVYAKIAPKAILITAMVAVSAIVSTISTFLSGTLSDRKGKRKPFIVFGYIMWGITTILFGLTEFVKVNNFVVIAIMIVCADAIMSFFGSLGNDAGFNPWTTDISNESNRGGLGAVIAIQPVIATIVGTLLGGVIIETKLNYIGFFCIMGGFVILIGIFSAFVLKDSPELKPNIDKRGFWKQFASNFNFKILKENRLLMLVLVIFAMFFISFNTYFPYITNYFIYARGYQTDMAGILLGVGLILAIPLTLVAGKIINKGKFVPTILVAILTNCIGLGIMALATVFPKNQSLIETITIIVAIFFVGAGYMVVYQSLMIWCKNLYPDDKRGSLEGVRLTFYVCIPMVLGPIIALPLIKYRGQYIPVQYETGIVEAEVPGWQLFVVAIAIAIITLIPLCFAYKEQRKKS